MCSDFASKKHHGTIPPQLFKFIDRNNMAAVTREFIDFMNGISMEFNRQIRDEYGAERPLYEIQDIKLSVPKLFGHDVSLEYVASGSVGSVYKMQIGDVTLALKINRYPQQHEDIKSMDMHRYARTLIRRPYIGGTDAGGYSWVLSDYIDGDDDGWVRAKEKLFNAAMTKGLRYSDLHPNNIRDGRIIDLPGLSRKKISLHPSELELVKKLMNFVRMQDTAGFEDMAARVAREHPDVMRYMYLTATMHNMEMPMHYQPFYKLMRKYNDVAKAASQTPSATHVMMNKNQRDG
ncbi:hypothetical protein HDR66_01795 [bacterium]|nr:hypothetical protein [bacterium]